MSGPHGDEPCPTLPGPLRHYYRELLASHAGGLDGRCLHCGRVRCAEWRYAYERLVSSGEWATSAAGSHRAAVLA